MLLNFNSPSYKSDICVSLMLRHLTFSVLISFDPNNDILNCSFIIQPINEKYIYFQGLFINERSDATSPDMINGVNQNVIFLMIKKCYVLFLTNYQIVKLKNCFIEILRWLVQLIKLHIVQFVCLLFSFCSR